MWMGRRWRARGSGSWRNSCAASRGPWWNWSCVGAGRKCRSGPSYSAGARGERSRRARPRPPPASLARRDTPPAKAGRAGTHRSGTCQHPQCRGNCRSRPLQQRLSQQQPAIGRRRRATWGRCRRQGVAVRARSPPCHPQGRARRMREAAAGLRGGKQVAEQLPRALSRLSVDLPPLSRQWDRRCRWGRSRAHQRPAGARASWHASVAK